MKKLLSIFVLILLTTHFLGFYTYFFVRLSQIRAEMRESISSLPPDQYEVFRLTPQEYKNVKAGDHEVRIDGKMYDHSVPRFENGEIILYSKHDKAEDNLLEFLSQVVSAHNGDKKPVPSQLLSFFNLIYLATPTLELRPLAIVAQAIFPPAIPLPDGYNGNTVPPPKA